MRSRALVVIAFLLHLALQAWPSLRPTLEVDHGRDFASYHYAVKEAAAGRDPYDREALEAAAQAEKTRRIVHPYFYPPPFLLTMTWALPLSLRDAARLMWALNELLLLGCVLVLRRGFGAPGWALALIVTAYTPIQFNAMIGQANLWVLLPLLAGLAVAHRRPWLGGALVGAAAMFKMSPAIVLGYWLLRGNLRAVAGAVVAAVGLSVATLPLVPLPVQLEFFREVLPGFFSGSYRGLTVPVVFVNNYGVPEFFARLWPGVPETSLSPMARLVAGTVNLVMLGLWASFFRDAPKVDGQDLGAATPVRADLAAVGALVVLMTLSPAYVYEHHLVMLLPSLVAGAVVGPRWAFLLLFTLLMWPIEWLEPICAALPSVSGLLQEEKFFAGLALYGLLLGRGRTTER